MTKKYTELNFDELRMEKMRLKYILANKPDYYTYKATKKSLERINKLMENYVIRKGELAK